jgi:hypothetical protein
MTMSDAQQSESPQDFIRLALRWAWDQGVLSQAQAEQGLDWLDAQPRWEPVTDESMTRTIEIVTSGLDEYEGCRLCRLVQPQEEVAMSDAQPLWSDERVNKNAEEWDKEPGLTKFGALRYAQHDMRGEYEADRKKHLARIAELEAKLAESQPVPDWSQAPKQATHYAVNQEGQGEWLTVAIHI